MIQLVKNKHFKCVWMLNRMINRYLDLNNHFLRLKFKNLKAILTNNRYKITINCFLILHQILNVHWDLDHRVLPRQEQMNLFQSLLRIFKTCCWILRIRKYNKMETKIDTIMFSQDTSLKKINTSKVLSIRKLLQSLLLQLK